MKVKLWVTALVVTLAALLGVACSTTEPVTGGVPPEKSTLPPPATATPPPLATATSPPPATATSPPPATATSPPETSSGSSQALEDLLVLSAELPASCQMIRPTPVSAMQERVNTVNFSGNPFVSSDREIIRFWTRLVEIEGSTVVRVMGAWHYVEPEVRDEFAYMVFQFDSEEHVAEGAAKLASIVPNDPETFAMFSGGCFLVYYYRDNAKEATDDCFFAVKDLIAQIIPIVALLEIPTVPPLETTPVSPPETAPVSPPETAPGPAQVLEDLILPSAERPASCEMISLTPISAVNERGSVNLPSNPFVSADREIIQFLAGTAGVEESTVVQVMGVQYYIDPWVHDEFDYFGFEFDSEEHAVVGTAQLARRGGNDPERFVVFSGGRFGVNFSAMIGGKELTAFLRSRI